MSKKPAGQADETATPPNRTCVTVLLTAVILFGCGWRFFGVTQWPSEFHVTRQYDGAILARAFRLRMHESALPESQQEWLRANLGRVIEPPLLEILVTGVYVVTGAEQPWVAYLFNSLFWLGGGWFVFDIARRMCHDIYAGILALAYYLLTPLAIILSRSFQPEAIMIFGMVVALWWLVRGGFPQTWSATLVAGVVCGLAMLVKPGIALFPIVATYLALGWQAVGFKRLIRSAQTYAFLGVFVLPSAAYGRLFLGGHIGEKVMPHLLLGQDFYRGWWAQLHATAGWFFVAGAVLGACLMVRRHGSYVPAALLLSYVVFGTTFTWHAMTHSYYHAGLIVIVAICLAPLAEVVRRAGRDFGNLQIAICLVVAIVSMWQLSAPATPLIRREPEYEQKVRFYTELGEVCGPGSTVIHLGEDYGGPLRYHGWLNVSSWPTQVDKRYEQQRLGSVEPDGERLQRMIKEISPGYFVITDLNQLRHQEELANLLDRNFKKRAEGPSAVVYDLQKRKT